MSARTEVIGFLIAVSMLVLVSELVRRRRLRIGYSLIWLTVALGAIVLIVFPWLVHLLARLMGIADARSLLFTAGISFAFLILLDHSLILTRLWRQDKDITQQHALLEWQVRHLRAQIDELTASRNDQLPAAEQSGSVVAWPGLPAYWMERSTPYALEEKVHESEAQSPSRRP